MKGKYYSRAVKLLVFIIDFWLINLAFRATHYFRLATEITRDQFTSFFLIFSLVWIITGFLYKTYRLDSFTLTRTLSVNLLGAVLTHMFLIAMLLTSFNNYPITLPFLACVYSISIILVAGVRIVYKIVAKYFEFSGFDQRNVIIIGATGSGRALYQFFASNQAAGYTLKGIFDDDCNHMIAPRDVVIDKLDSIKEFCLREKVDEIYFALPPINQDFIKDLSRFADNNFIYFRIVPDFSRVMQENYNVFLINSIPILTTRREPLGITMNAHLKRAFDIAFSLCVIGTVFPFVLPVIALAIRLDSPGPIFFKQLRPGKRNKLFECYKFRTMRVNGTTELQATKNDSRITRVGRFLRKSNLDELPQFFNVLLGSMSVVGPRPNMISQLEEYSKTIDDYKVRHFVTPGITGYAQVNGFRGETKELELMAKRVEYDVRYMENWSFSLDLKIIFQTVWNMVRGEKNAY